MSDYSYYSEDAHQKKTNDDGEVYIKSKSGMTEQNVVPEDAL